MSTIGKRPRASRIDSPAATQIGQWITEGRIRDAKTLVGLYAFLYSPILNK